MTVYRAEDFPHGLRCCECDYRFTREGEAIAQRLVGMGEIVDEPVFYVELICIPCSLRLKAVS